MRLQLLASLLLATTFAAPANAQASDTTPKNPWVASGLTVGTPLVIGGTIPLLKGLAGPQTPNPLASAPFFIAPLGIEAGYAYAGDPLRGALVTAGEYVVMGGGLALTSAFSPNGNNGPQMSAVAGAVAWTAMLAYLGWAGYDAYQTTERKNAEAAARP